MRGDKEHATTIPKVMTLPGGIEKSLTLLSKCKQKIHFEST